jgi:hypothetical protein
MLRHGAGGFTSPPKVVLLSIFIALKNPLLPTGFEPENLASSGEHDNHYTTENDYSISNDVTPSHSIVVMGNGDSTRFTNSHQEHCYS